MFLRIQDLSVITSHIAEAMISKAMVVGEACVDNGNFIMWTKLEGLWAPSTASSGWGCKLGGKPTSLGSRYLVQPGSGPAWSTPADQLRPDLILSRF